MNRPRSSGGVLGTSLIAVGLALLALATLWRLSIVLSGNASFASLVFFLVLALIVAGPFIGAGVYLRSKGQQETTQAGVFSERRAVLDSDVALRREVVRELEQTLQSLGTATRALSNAAAASVQRAQRLLADARDDLARPGYSAATLLEGSAGLRADQHAIARRYDDLVSSQARRLGQLVQRLQSDASDTAAGTLAAAAELFASHVAERESLLGRGQIAASLSPQDMLAAGAAPRRRVEDPVSLNLEDAVSFEGEDYIARGVLDYFGGGRRWRMYQLHDGHHERWLEVRADGTQLAWLLRLADPPAVTGESASHAGAIYTASDRGAATVNIESAAGRQAGVLVDYQRYLAGSDVLTVETWPDGPRFLAGRAVSREDVELWTRPAATE
ncbi:MAG: DUF4178 domain-containing protein [Chloroflexota bacterium]